MFKKRSAILLILVAWFLYTNHCILSDAFALSQSEKSSTESSGCCPHSKEDNSKEQKEPLNHHSKCKDSGCCQPVFKGDSSLKIGAAELFQADSFFEFIGPSWTVGALALELKRAYVPPINSPPLNFSTSIDSLDLAPNAPPVSHLHI
jgi:hypothetical protein